MEYGMLVIGIALGVIIGLIGAIVYRLHGLAAEMQRMSEEIHELAKSHVEMAHVLNHITEGINEAHKVLNEHDQIIAFMKHEQDEDYPVH